MSEEDPFVTRPKQSRYRKRIARAACGAASEACQAVENLFRDASWAAYARGVDPQNDTTTMILWKAVQAVQAVEEKYDTLYKLAHGIAVLREKEEKHGEARVP